MPPFSQILRRGVRAFVPESAYLYLARRYGASVASRLLGKAEYARLIRTENAPRGGPDESFTAPGIRHPLSVRPGTTDAAVFEDTLLRRLYGILQPRTDVTFVIDAGANAGYSSVFFANRWPGATIVALEPDPKNFAVTQANVAPYPRVTARMLALWPTAAFLKVQGSDREDAVSVAEVADPSQADCEAIDPMSLARAAGAPRIGLFKCDIEGGEEPLFRTNPDPWLAITDHVMIEIHSPAAHQAVYSAMGRHPFDAFRYRELHVFVRRDA